MWGKESDRLRKMTIFVVGICSVFLTVFFSFTTSILSQNRPTVIMLLVPELTRQDIRALYQNAAFSFLNQAAIGEMNMRTAVSLRDIHSVLTLGTGTRAAGSEWGRNAYGLSEKRTAGLAMYRQYMGEVPAMVRNGTILFPYASVLAENNKQKNTGAIPGLLGETLKKHGIRRAVIGNSDMSGKVSRLSVLLTMDRRGVTPQGWIGEETLIHSPFFPGGKKTDYSFLAYHVRQWQKRGTGFIAVELGDLVRLARYQSVISTQRYLQLRQQVMEEIAKFTETLTKERTQGQKIVLLSASLPDSEIAEKKRMAPVLLWEDGRGGGILTSGTTRQPGLAANIDMAPTILTWFGIQPPIEMKGMPLRTEREIGHDEFWKKAERIDHIYATRPAVLYPYVGMTITVLVLSSVLLFSFDRWKSTKEKALRILSYLLPFVLLVPFLLLLLPVVPGLPPPFLVVLLVSGVGLGFAHLLQRLSFAACYFWIGIINWVPLLLDGFTGGGLIRGSYLGYDPVIGARYYGIGNEYMGVLLGAFILSIAMAGEMQRRHARRLVLTLLILITGLVIFYMAWPEGGSKAGGILVFLAALVYGIPAFSGFAWRKRYVAALLGIGMAAACLLFVLNYQAAGAEQSHIGRAVGELARGNWQEIGRIIERKLTMNWRLILASIWSKLFIASFIVSLLLIYYQSERVGRIKREYPWLTIGIKTISFGSFVALLVNDSGIIAAALAMLYALVPILYRLLWNGEASKEYTKHAPI